MTETSHTSPLYPYEENLDPSLDRDEDLTTEQKLYDNLNKTSCDKLLNDYFTRSNSNYQSYCNASHEQKLPLYIKTKEAYLQCIEDGKSYNKTTSFLRDLFPSLSHYLLINHNIAEDCVFDAPIRALMEDADRQKEKK